MKINSIVCTQVFTTNHVSGSTLSHCCSKHISKIETNGCRLHPMYEQHRGLLQVTRNWNYPFLSSIASYDWKIHPSYQDVSRCKRLAGAKTYANAESSLSFTTKSWATLLLRSFAPALNALIKSKSVPASRNMSRSILAFATGLRYYLLDSQY